MVELIRHRDINRMMSSLSWSSLSIQAREIVELCNTAADRNESVENTVRHETPAGDNVEFTS